MLSKQVVPIAFREGLDTKTSKENGVPGRLTEMQNGVFGKIGEIRLRYGYDRISSNIEGGTALTSCDALATYRNELLQFSGGRVYSYSEARSSWLDRGAAATALVTEKQAVRNTYQQSCPDVAISGGLTCVAYEDTRGGVRYSITDTETGAVLVADTEINALGTRPYVVAFNSEFVIFYAIGNNIFYRRVSTSDPRTLGGEVNPIATLDPTDLSYDVTVIGSRLYVVWVRTAASTLAYFDTSFALTTVSAALGSCDIITVFGDSSSRAWCVLSGVGNQSVVVYDSAGSVVSGPTTIGTSATNSALAGCVPSGSSTATLFAGDSSTLTIRVMTIDVSGAATTGTNVRSVSLAGKAFAYGGAVYVPVVHSSTMQGTVFVIDTSGNVVAKAYAGVAGGARSRNTMANIANSATGSYTFATSVKTDLESTSGGLFTRNGIGLVTLDFAGAGRFASAELGNNLLVAGGVVNAYDGVTLAESGFHLYPEGSTASVGAGGGGLTVAEVYSWKVIYEWTDAHGQVHRSAPGNVTIAGAASYTSAAGSETVTLTIPTLRITGKSLVRIAVYRTEGNGSVYYRLTPIATPTLNSTTTDSVTFSDTYADTAIVGNEILYTDGAAGSSLENIAPGHARGIVTHQGRAFYIAGPNKISFSQICDDGEPPTFNDALYIIPDTRGGDLVALASMDDKLVILKESAVFVTAGPGPDDSGAGEFPAPILVTTDVGCSEPRSVVSTSAGLMFDTPKGIYLLDRSLAVTYIGAQVEDYNDLTITSASLVASQNQVRFTTSGSIIVGTEALSDLALVYDYAFGQWSVFTNCGGVDSLVWDGTYTYAKSNGKTYTEDTSNYDDDGAFVKLRVTTSWLSFAGVQGYQRCYRALILGDYKNAHTLRVRLGYDFRPEFTYDETINAETIIAPGSWGSSATWGSDSLWGGNAPVEWFVAKPERQKCSSIRVSVETVQNGSTVGASFSIANLALLVGVKRGAQKLASSRVV